MAKTGALAVEGKGPGVIGEIETLFDNIPLPLLFAMTVAVVFLSVVGGFGMGSFIRRRKGLERETSVGSVIGAMLGLLAFILAFTFGMAASRYDARKQLLLDETNAIGTAFLRTDFLPAPQSAEAKELFRKYVNLRVDVGQHPEKQQQGLAETDSLQGQLWSQVAELARQPDGSGMLRLYVQSLNEVIDLHGKRVIVGLEYRIPGGIWLALYFVTMLAMFAVGFDFGRNNTGSVMISLMMALAFSSVILLIADLERNSKGFVRVSQRPMIELQQKLHAVRE